MNERLEQVALELAAAVSAEPGPDGKRHLPVLQSRDVVGLVAMLNEQLDTAIEHREAAAAERQIVIACKRGCNACCTTPVLVGEHEVIAVAEWLKQPENAAVLARYRAAYAEWRAALGPVVEQVIDAETTLEERVAEGAAFRSHRAMCPFNHGGDCAIYPVRPSLCRKAHALWTHEKCADDVGEVEYFAYREVEDTFAGQEGMHVALHAALRPRRNLELLPKAVKRRLDGPSAGRNDPCVCGSGQKFKKCCGA